ncbi:hypothetical protein ADUPG1_007151 [Aduncisulcus paluster]|uniref:Uncharacterized protein n=1 Tax=Aduncisulcus paluster TaxID=2918883 RepID=A0ABQ5KKY0_9EUKA|nr:hypothetical protein ADUPG1_007151 [Aduncisulcus paluster]
MDPKPTSERSQDIIQEVKPVFIHEGDESSSPIPRDCPNIKSPDITAIESKNRTKRKGDREYDQCSAAQKMMKGEGNRGKFTDISLPFSTSTPIKGACICIGREYVLSSISDSQPKHLIFSFTSSKGEKMISGKGRKKESFEIESLIFFREETHEETIFREAKEAFRNKLWSDAPVVKPEFVKEGDRKSQGRESIPIPRDDPKLVDPSFSMVKGKDDSKSKESEGYDQSSRAQRMLKGEWFVSLSHLSIPFSSPSPMKGAYICVSDYGCSPSLLFTFTDCDGKKIFKKYEFTRPKYKCEWHFLPIDLDNVVLCEIEGKGMWKEKNSRCFCIFSLVFFRDDDKLTSHTQIVEPEFIHDDEYYDSSPVKWDSPNIQSTYFSKIQAIDGTCAEDSRYHYQSYNAQKMMKGKKHHGSFTHISIPFSLSSPIKGAYTFLGGIIPPSYLIFTFTSSKGERTPKRYDFPRTYSYSWYFLPIDLSDVVLCEITGKRSEEESFKKKDNFNIRFLVFCRKKMSLISQIVTPEFVHEGDEYCCPVSQEAPNIKRVDFSSIDALVSVRPKDESLGQLVMKGEGKFKRFDWINIPFLSSSPMKGAYICLSRDRSDSLPSHLLFTLTSSTGEKTGKKYNFPEFEGYHWYFLPIDLSDVVLCRIKGKDRGEDEFSILSLVFIRKETHEETIFREAKESFRNKLWSEAPVVKPEFVQEGDRDSIPIPRDDTELVDPSFSIVKGKNDAFSKESEEYDQSSQAQKMLKGECGVWLSHLSIPFPSPNPLKGAYICVNVVDSSPSLLFTFTDCDGKKTCKKYEFTRPKHRFEWHFLPIELDNIVSCEIEGKGIWGWWKRNNSRSFKIDSLVFTVIPKEIAAAERLSLFPWRYGLKKRRDFSIAPLVIANPDEIPHLVKEKKFFFYSRHISMMWQNPLYLLHKKKKISNPERKVEEE